MVARTLLLVLVWLTLEPTAWAQSLVSHSVIYDVKPAKGDAELFFEGQATFTLARRCDGWSLGEVFQFQVKATPESGMSPMDLRTLLDWFIAYQLRRVEGVTEINPHGGQMKTYEVQADAPGATGVAKVSSSVQCAPPPPPPGPRL